MIHFHLKNTSLHQERPQVSPVVSQSQAVDGQSSEPTFLCLGLTKTKEWRSLTVAQMK
jgi:hypothetical protein